MEFKRTIPGMRKMKEREEFKTAVANYSAWQDFQMLVKFRLTLTVLFSAALAFLITGVGLFSWQPFLLLLGGGFLITAAANIFNEVLEKEFDRQMKRTENRPLPGDRISVSKAVLLGGLFSLLGVTLLSSINMWCGLLGMLSFLLYAFVYTPMKRISPAAIFIGAIPGALPMMIGSLAASGEMTNITLMLFGIQFFWQFPHFWSIAYLAREDYSLAGFRIIDEENPKNMARESLFYLGLLLVTSFLPFIIGLAGYLYLAGSLCLGILFLAKGIRFFRDFDKSSARSLLFASLIYLPCILTLFYFDRLSF